MAKISGDPLSHEDRRLAERARLAERVRALRAEVEAHLERVRHHAERAHARRAERSGQLASLHEAATERREP